MPKQIHEDIRIDRAGIEEILKLHVERTESIDRASTRVVLEVGTRTEGYGRSETDVPVFRGAKVETVTPITQDDVLAVLGRRTFLFDEAEVKEAIGQYVAKARGVSRAAVQSSMMLSGRHQGDRGGWEGPSLNGVTVTIKIV